MTDQPHEGGTSVNDASSPTPSGGGAPTQKNPILWVTGAIVLLVLAGILFGQAPTEQQKENITASDVSENTSNTSDASEEIELSETFLHAQLVADFEDRQEVTSILNSTQGKPVSGEGSERVLSGVVSSDDEQSVYFATSSYDEETQENFVGIYQFQIQSNRWQRLFKTTYLKADQVPEEVIASTGGVGTRTLRVAGRSGSDLILVEDFVGNQLGACASLLLRGNQEHFTLYRMNIEDPYGDFTQITLGPDEETRELERVKECSSQ